MMEQTHNCIVFKSTVTNKPNETIVEINNGKWKWNSDALKLISMLDQSDIMHHLLLRAYTWEEFKKTAN